MNFWILAVLTLTFVAPAAAILFLAWKSGKTQGSEVKACLALFGLAMVAAALGVAKLDHPVRMEFLWPLTLEQSGYFEFSLQLLWSRFVWIFFSAAMLLGLSVFDFPSASREGLRSRLLFLTGSYFFLVLAFLSENILLSLMFVEIAAFMIHTFSSGDPGAADRDSYFKRSCFVFLGLTALHGLAFSHQLSSSSVMLMGVVFYIVSILVSRHSPTHWSQLILLFVQLGMALFLMERVMGDDVSSELWVPLAGVFALGTICFATLSVMAPARLSASFWLTCSFLGYLLYLRFSSAKPTDPFWGTFEAIGLGAAVVITNILRFGERLDLLWKRMLAFAFVALALGIASGALPSVEAGTIRFDSDTSIARMGLLGLLTFLVAVASGRGVALSLEKGESRSQSALLAPFAPALLMILAQAGMLLRWNELNFEEMAGSDLGALLADPRMLLTLAASTAGLLCGGLLGSNGSFAAWTKRRDLRMEDFFPAVDPSLLHTSLRFVRMPERGVEWLSGKIAAMGGEAASAVESADRGFFGERFFRRLADSSDSLSNFTRIFHSGQARAYLFLGVLITLLSSFIFLLEGR
ncbi:MAG: hypothetical protein ACXVCK_02850 [Bdellovibrionota bacterium]